MVAAQKTAGGVECPNVKNATFDAESRDAVVNRNNELRSTLAFGTAVYKGGERLKSGKNIYQLVSVYNCRCFINSAEMYFDVIVLKTGRSLIELS
uniref:Cystatin domain-containing protein n=1 Tax=Ascaris lumbricoides TaxID=6252 RepID=A0A0M3ISK8_ASCLU